MLKNKPLVAVGIVLLAVAAYLVGRWTSSESAPAPETEALQTPPVKIKNAQTAAVSSSKENKEMPYADLLDKAGEKYGFKFHYEKWSVWEKQIKENLADFFVERKQDGWPHTSDIEEITTDYLMKEYKELWRQGVALADAPLPKTLHPPLGTPMYIEYVWDETLGDSRPRDPTIYVDMSQMTIFEGGGVAYNQDAFRYKDGADAELLSDEDYHNVIHRGMAPPGVKVVYIGEDGQELPHGEAPAALDPAESFKHLSDEELQPLVEGMYGLLTNPTSAQQTILDEVMQTPNGRMQFEDALYGLMAAWLERPSAWNSAPSPSKTVAPPPGRSPDPVGHKQSPDPTPTETGPKEPSPLALPPPPDFEAPATKRPSTNPRISAPELQVLLDLIKREQTGEGLTDEERSILQLKELYDLYQSEAEAERRRLRKRSDGPPAAPPPR